MPRLDIDRQNKLQPKRMAYAKSEIEKRGYSVTEVGDTELQFEYNGKIIKFFPYSGWATGGTIKDGRGLKKLLEQI